MTPKPLFRLTLWAALCSVALVAEPATPPVAQVDGGVVARHPEDRNLLVACVMSELGAWKGLDSVNVHDKATAISYVILRRTLDGMPKGQHTIKETILARDQFYGMTLKEADSGPFKGKPEVHAALASLDPAYREEVLTRARTHPSDFIRRVLHLLPSDTAGTDDALQFQHDLRSAAAGVDEALSGKAKDLSNGARFFGGVGDIFKTSDHKPSKIVAVVGGLGPFANLQALLADPQIKSSAHRLHLRDDKGVDAIFFFQ
jgi:hypothetical protein